ncbi:MAG TPA: microviridin/marinostatin family tricyclic proteinase inhibitor [Pyrinomonadaceae bacterium]
MKGRKKKGPAAPPSDAAASTPFFARFLEDQHGDDAEARVSARRPRAQATARKSGGTTKASVVAQTMKAPSDKDEWVVFPYHVEAATAQMTRQTLKYPSDRDEDGPYFVLYADAADAPKTATSKPKLKKEAKVRLTAKAADSDQVS